MTKNKRAKLRRQRQMRKRARWMEEYRAIMAHLRANPLPQSLMERLIVRQTRPQSTHWLAARKP